MRRRDLLAAAAAPFAPPPGAAGVTITRLETFAVHVNRRGDWILARLGTSAGLTGLGDASHGRSGEATVKFLHGFFELLEGRGIFEGERLRQAAEPTVAKNGTTAACALSALEQCLWDLRGQMAGVPTADLFGGRLHARIRNYANVNRSTGDNRVPSDFARLAEAAVRAGFDAVKLAPWDGMPRGGDAAQVSKFTDLGVECIAAVRRVIGPDRDLLVDAHNHFDLASGLALARRLEPFDLFWLEETTRSPRELAEINRAAKMKTAGGESLFGVKGFLPYISAGAVDIVMPDVKYCGGMLELKKIAALAEAAGLPVAPHGPASPVGNVAAAHVCAALPNFLILEHAFGEVPWRAELIDPPETLESGRMTIAGRPGFGIALNEKTLARYRA